MGAEADLPAQGSARLPGLEALRWVAASCVLALHTEVIFGLPAVFGKGYLGVDLFFMLSGFVMARSFAGKPPEPIGRFMLDRYLRMWPIMALGGLIGLPLLHARVPDLAQYGHLALANLALVPVAFDHETFPLNVPAWTILFILLGNLLHRLVLFRLARAWLALAIAASAAIMSMVAAQAGSFDVGARPENAALAVPRLLLSYLIGIALQTRLWSGFKLRVPALLALLAMPLLLAGAWWFEINSWLFDLGFVAIACPLMIAGVMRLRVGAGLASFAGAWSFPLYALHFPLLIRLRNHGYTAGQAGIIALVLSALVTWAEIRLRARLKR